MRLATAGLTGALAGIALVGCIAAVSTPTTTEPTTTTSHDDVTIATELTSTEPVELPTDTDPDFHLDVDLDSDSTFEPVETTTETEAETPTTTETQPVSVVHPAETGHPTYTLPPCQLEDDLNCYWDAATMGNGTGHSFINLNGSYYYAD